MARFQGATRAESPPKFSSTEIYTSCVGVTEGSMEVDDYKV